MHKPNRIGGSFLVAFGVILAGILYGSDRCLATVGTVVPSYFYPGTGGPGGVGDGWAAMAAAAPNIPLIAVLNPNSGPLAGPADPNYTTAMTNLENASGKTVAYVFTDDGGTPLASVESQIGTYLTQYGTLIDGFYLDGMSVTPSTLSYYQSIDAYIKGLSPGFTVVGNPGQPYLNGVSPANYLTTADIFDLFEGPGTAPMSDPGFNNYPYGQTWYQSYPAGGFDNTIYDVPSESAMVADVSTAAGLNAGYVYVTDQGAGNPYAQLPSYWDQEVAAITSLPEPAAAGLIAVAATGLLGRRRRYSCPGGPRDRDDRPGRTWRPGGSGSDPFMTRPLYVP
jgi:hypothetical protein